MGRRKACGLAYGEYAAAIHGEEADTTLCHDKHATPPANYQLPYPSDLTRCRGMRGSAHDIRNHQSQPGDIFLNGNTPMEATTNDRRGV